MILPMAVATVMVAIAAFAGCSKGTEPAPTAQLDSKTIALKPTSSSVQLGFLTGELTDLTVSQTVNTTTGETVQPPKLRATLKLRNASSDQVARLVSGRVEYLDAGGKSIPLAKDRQDTSFKFYSYQGDRLDPGMETSQGIEVPFPMSAMKDGHLADVRLRVAYIPSPFRTESASVAVSMAN
jgi:hypothetical protein